MRQTIAEALKYLLTLCGTALRLGGKPSKELLAGRSVVEFVVEYEAVKVVCPDLREDGSASDEVRV